MNGDLSVRAVVDTTQIEWAPSPSGSVWRKRVHLVGPPESGQVTSVVRYEPHSRFPAHDHPEGEEILVLDGVFSDEHGDWPAGTLLLNPEGFRHTPFSEPGCLLFVKLRQFAGRERHHVIIDTHKLTWEPSSIPGATYKTLYQQAGFSDRILLEPWGPQADLGVISYEMVRSYLSSRASLSTKPERTLQGAGCVSRRATSIIRDPPEGAFCTSRGLAYRTCVRPWPKMRCR